MEMCLFNGGKGESYIGRTGSGPSIGIGGCGLQIGLILGGTCGADGRVGFTFSLYG